MNTDEDTYDPPTENTEPDSPRSEVSKTSSIPKNSPMIDKILSSTEEIINEQAKKIFDLNNELNTLKKGYSNLLKKHDLLLKSFPENTNNPEKIDNLLSTINELESALAMTKIELAMCKGQALVSLY